MRRLLDRWAARRMIRHVHTTDAVSRDSFIVEARLWRVAGDEAFAERCEHSAETARLFDTVKREYRLAEILAEVYLYVDWRYLSKQLTTEQKELWADVIETHSEDGLTVDRWWRE